MANSVRAAWTGGWYDQEVCRLLMRYGFNEGDAWFDYKTRTALLGWKKLGTGGVADQCELPDITDPQIKADFLKYLEVRLKISAHTSTDP